MFDQWITPKGRLSSKQPQYIKNQWYIQKFQEVHGDLYDYSRVQYTGSIDTVDIICKIHGVFSQRVSNHISGRGCQKCQGTALKSLQEQLQDFRQVHRDTYDYSSVRYVNSTTPVQIFCDIHGIFEQQPQDHIQGRGCPKCQFQNQDTVYLIRCLNTGLIKIGITNNIKKRLSSIGGSLELIGQYQIAESRSVEKTLHKEYQEYRVFNPTVLNGNTEFFDITEQQLKEIIDFLTSSILKR